MAPSAIEIESPTTTKLLSKDVPAKLWGSNTTNNKPYIPLQSTGSLKEYEKFDLTPIVGTQFSDINLSEILRSPDADMKIKDLAIMISERGVCVFPKQKDLTIEEQKILGRKLGELTYRPHSSGLHIHPINQTTNEDGSVDPYLVTMQRDLNKKLYKREAGHNGIKIKRQSHADNWHTDSSFETIPADYTLLQMKATPRAGGDTLFASAYEVYDLLSEPYAKFLEGLTGNFAPPHHDPASIVDRMWKGHRGSPANTGASLRATHPCVRTNPVTGWKAVYAMGHHLESINGLADVETKLVIKHLESLITQNHHLQLRVRWNPDDLVIWDNRAVYHCATFDYTDFRAGNRICGCGEKPFLDPRSSSRRYALGL